MPNGIKAQLIEMRAEILDKENQILQLKSENPLGMLSEEEKPVVGMVIATLISARQEEPLDTAHQSYAMLLEALENLWTAIKSKDGGQMTGCAMHLAILSIRFMVEVPKIL